MLKFTSVSGSVRAITADITLTVTIIRTGITIDLIIVPITGRIGTAGIVIIATIIVIPIITGASLTGIATLGWLEIISSQPNFFRAETSRGDPAARDQAIYLPYFGDAAGLDAGLLPGSSIWNSFLSC
jgi:hypothetical protein